MRKIIILFCLILVNSSVSAEKLPCLNLTAVDNPAIAYTQRDNRCEGFYQSPVAAESLTLVSLLYGRLEFDANSNECLHVIVPQAIRQQVHVQAVGIPLKTYYRMDAWVQPGQDFTWPLDIIGKMRLTPASIGLLGKTIADLEAYTPLALGNQAPLNLILRSSVDVRTVLWRISSMNEGQCGQPDKKWEKIEPSWGEQFFSGEGIQLSLPEQRENFCIEFAAQTVGSASWLKLFLKILLKE
ncbi:hypothetical protein H206_03633 [Candidatus Electrothrix aarhusensis]|uniref:Uncharacterized protein n=1 Tax=Candidatus Electrothrix aarhusensis TaxID=1859131 RepID=A0A444J1B5_9BACT|nr:hypothetical protein H206_03633 [Candidatus Electrothrix aarhusensis]